MDRKQRIAIAAPPLLVLSMIGVYRLLARSLGARKAWYVGFWVHWCVWGLGFPLWLLGFKGVKDLFAYRRLHLFDWFVLILPPALSVFGRKSSNQERPRLLERAALILTGLMNGTLEEVLWRGVYLALFTDNPLWGVAWPTLWFALWHYAPGSVSPLTDVRMLMVGAGVYGSLLSSAAMKTRSIRWTVVSHTLSGLVRALA